MLVRESERESESGVKLVFKLGRQSSGQQLVLPSLQIIITSSIIIITSGLIILIIIKSGLSLIICIIYFLLI